MIPATVRIFVCTEPVDMRRGFDGLALIARQQLSVDPMSGAMFIFANRSRNRLKMLWWDSNGYCVLYKRLHRALFELPVANAAGTASVRIDGKELGALLAGVAKVRKRKAKLHIVR